MRFSFQYIREGIQVFHVQSLSVAFGKAGGKNRECVCERTVQVQGSKAGEEVGVELVIYFIHRHYILCSSSPYPLAQPLQCIKSIYNHNHQRY